MFAAFFGTVISFFISYITGTCHILNGGCEDICIPVTNGRRCECDIGLQLQTDNTCDSGRQCFFQKYLNQSGH